MKKRMLALILCLTLPLCGCSAMLERSHVTSTDHVPWCFGLCIGQCSSLVPAEINRP